MACRALQFAGIRPASVLRIKSAKGCYSGFSSTGTSNGSLPGVTSTATSFKPAGVDLSTIVVDDWLSSASHLALLGEHFGDLFVHASFPSCCAALRICAAARKIV